MSYETMAGLAADTDLEGRVLACSKEQAAIFKDDGRYSMAALATAVLQNPSNARGVFELVVVSPDFKEIEDGKDVTDGQILSAVQAVWPVYGEAAYPEPPAEAGP